jgi:hypothetical protein
MLRPAFLLLSPFPASAFLASVASSPSSQLWPATLGGGSARRRPHGHAPVHLTRCCPLPSPKRVRFCGDERSHPIAPPPCVLLGAPWKRPVLHRPRGGSHTRVQGPSWRTLETPAMERQGFSLNEKEEVVHVH